MARRRGDTPIEQGRVNVLQKSIVHICAHPEIDSVPRLCNSTLYPDSVPRLCNSTLYPDSVPRLCNSTLCNSTLYLDYLPRLCTLHLDSATRLYTATRLSLHSVPPLCNSTLYPD